MRKFNRDEVKRGDLMVLARDGKTQVRFKMMALDSGVIASWVEPPPGRPLDVIGRQCDFLIPEQQAESS